MATAHSFSLISFRLKSNKATKVAPIVPTDSKQFQKSHFRSTETKKCLIDMAPVRASTSTTRIPTTTRHTIDKGLRTFSWRLNERIITCSAPRNGSARWTCTSPGIPDQTVPGTLAGKGSQACWPYGETHHPTGDEDQGRSSWCWAACGRSRPLNGLATACWTIL